MYATVSDGRDEEFAASADWLNRFVHRNQTPVLNKCLVPNEHLVC